MNPADEAHLIAHAKRIAEMERILDRELREIKREQERPYWHLPLISFATILTLMAISGGAVFVYRHPIF
jgi:hypothetical protein